MSAERRNPLCLPGVKKAYDIARHARVRGAGRVETSMHTVISAIRLAAAVTLLAIALPAAAASFADLAALSLAAPIVVRATVVKTERLGKSDAPDVAPGMARLLVTAATTAAIAAPGEVPPRLTYLVDVALDDRRRPPRLDRKSVV